MFSRWCALAVLASLGVMSAAPGADDGDVAKAQKAVEKKVEGLKAEGGELKVVAEAPLAKVFPGQVFFFLRFRQFPVARIQPEGVPVSSLFAADKDGKVQHLADVKGLEKFFAGSLPAVKDDDAAKNAVRAWLRLAPEFVQDGFYKFTLMDDSTKAMADGKGRKATGQVVAMEGGNGSIGATMTFDEAGRLTSVMETIKLKAGPRPICQATKLLDADPIVRRMAEADLLIMGRAARGYLDEQRAKASPELRRAIDQLWERIEESDR